MTVSAPTLAERQLSQRTKRIKVAPTIFMSQRSAALREQGHDIIDLSVGEPDFTTPDNVIEAAHRAAMNGQTRYTAPDGTKAVKDAVRQKLMRDNRLAYDLDEIGVVSGCKQVIFNAFAATLDADDEVVIFVPCWVSYIDMVKFHDAKPVMIETRPENGFLPNIDEVEAAMSPRTKWVLVNSPCNPTGAVFPTRFLRGLADLINDHPAAMVLSDEIYEQLVYGSSEHISILNVDPSMKSRTLLVNGVSKTYAMTGWRSGFCAGPSWLVSAMAKVQSQSAGSSSSIGQAAAAEAMIGDQRVVATRRKTMWSRRDLAADLLRTTNRLSFQVPQGAFYLFIDVTDCIGLTAPDGRVINSDRDFVEYLLDTARVATVPGTDFGWSPAIRLTFAAEDNVLRKACERVVSACDALRHQS